MGQVVNTLLPVPSQRTVRARLVAPVGWYRSSPTMFAEVVTGWSTTIADGGGWSLTLPPSSSFDASSTYYLIDEPAAQHAAVVPDGSGPFQLRDIAINNPGAAPCCPPPAASGSDGGVLAGRVGVVEVNVGTHEVRLGVLDVSDGSQNVRLAALEASGGLASLDYRHVQSSPVALVQIVHGLPFRPAGALCVDLLDRLTEPDRITNPLPGITEVLFGAAFAGVINLS